MGASKFGRLWQYRGFILGSVLREIRQRYRGSLLGACWLIFTPLVMIGIYTLVFSKIMHSRLPGVSSDYAYSIYLCAGLLQWNLFAEIVQRLQGIFLDNANLIKKSNFPRLALPLVTVMGSGFNFVVIYGLFLLILLVLGQLYPAVLVYPLILLLLVWLAGAGGLLLAVLNVFFRDIGQLTAVGLQLLFWATPVVYPASILPAWSHPLMALNPLYALMEASHTLHLTGKLFDVASLIYPAAWALVLTVLASLIYRRLYADLLDEI
jgi:lipopolysaccharide transport system permease protein